MYDVDKAIKAQKQYCEENGFSAFCTEQWYLLEL
jgi:hypothetical protein